MNKDKVIAQLKRLKQGNPPEEGAGIFGANIPEELAQLVLLPIPFEVTTSYGGGTSNGPSSILDASHQLDLFDRLLGNSYLAGISMIPESEEIQSLNETGKPLAQQVIQSWEANGQPDEDALIEVNRISVELNQKVYEQSKKLLQQGKLVGLVGGDHSCPLGLMKALGEVHSDFGILHVDAHHDLRVAYEGFTYSHASIIYNAVQEVSEISKVVSVGIRDFSEDESQFAAQSSKIDTIYDLDMARKIAGGASFFSIIEEVLSKLPKKVYISFDIDGLDPHCCPNTGTPVAGGLSYNQGILLLEALKESGRQVIGFDLCEVSPGSDEWDANVGARVLYKLCGLTLNTNQKLSLLER